MDTPKFDELLSAYIDQELGPDERAVVERQLNRSERPHKKLQELREASRMVRGLPRVQLEDGFADQVCERLPPSAKKPDPPKRRWSILPVAGLGLAASVLIAGLVQGLLLRSEDETPPLAAVPKQPPPELHGDELLQKFVLTVDDRAQFLKELEQILCRNQIDVTPPREPEDPREQDRITAIEVEAEQELFNKLVRDIQDETGAEVVVASRSEKMANSSGRINRAGSVHGNAKYVKAADSLDSIRRLIASKDKESVYREYSAEKNKELNSKANNRERVRALLYVLPDR